MVSRLARSCSWCECELQLVLVGAPDSAATVFAEPLPMKLRALPQSFWQQPNAAGGLSPGAVYPVLPPLCCKDDDGAGLCEVVDLAPDGALDPYIGLGVLCFPAPATFHADPCRPECPSCPPRRKGFSGDWTASTPARSIIEGGRHARGMYRGLESVVCPAGLRPATPPEERDKRRVVSVANTELLFSLFRSVEQLDQPAARVARRGRPKKVAATSWRLPRDEDPCLVSAVADPILPLIRGHAGGQHQVLATVSLGAGERSVVLPSLSVEHNYSQILSELVMKL
ncbi:uncharacterized protein LOC124606396 [Schistocerca americana]|uniref:uncharacterized protein LOC124606396 n=1 Tax=Schistocerca americana TaxID=7009 RepID=UPI001F5026BC|nr:uncharacterized protein LOC124606396 [Schistocerca americana]